MASGLGLRDLCKDHQVTGCLEMNPYDVMLNLKRLECHCIAALEAIAYYLKECEANRIAFLPGFRFRDLRDCHDDLERTYLIRLFAQFEIALRDYWEREVRDTSPRVHDLLESLGGRLFIQYDVVSRAHAVREYRNAIVHGGNAAPVTLAEARSYLCTYLSNLPRHY